MVKLKISLCHDKAEVPSYAHPGDSGMDLYAVEYVKMLPGNRTVVPTGLKADIPEGYELQIRPRSGIAAKTPLSVHFGTVDSGYLGEIGIIVENTSASLPYLISPGDRLAQMVLCPVVKAVVEVVEEAALSQSSRGNGGFGSTGVSCGENVATEKGINYAVKSLKIL